MWSRSKDGDYICKIGSAREVFKPSCEGASFRKEADLDELDAIRMGPEFPLRDG